MSLAYASDRGTAFIDRAPYLPRSRARDRERRAAAGIPKGARFATKIALARRLLTRAFAAAVPARWVVADSFYGRSHALRRWLEQWRRPYVLMIPETTAVQYQGCRERAAQLGARLPETAWRALPTDAPDRMARAHQWVCLTLSDRRAAGMCRWLLVRRIAADPGELAYHVAYGPEGTAVAELARVCEARWQIEGGFAQVKGEVGLDQYAVRRWVAWHRFVTLCLLAHAYLAVLRLHARAPGAATEGGAGEPGLLPLTVPEVRRLVLALAGGAEQWAFRLGWSRWRRRHQVIAARSQAARRGRDWGAPPATPVIPPPAVPAAALTDAEWALVRPLLPRHDHRQSLRPRPPRWR